LITLWGRVSSANVQKVLWALEEIGLPHEHVELGGRFGGLDTAEFAAMNPNRRVPVLRDGDLVLWESHAILRYLCARYAAGTLWPEDVRRRAPVDQWTDWTATTLQPAWIGLFWQFVRTPADKQNARAIARAHDLTVTALRIMDANLADKAFLAGDSLTYADIAAGVCLYRWTTMDVERPSLPHIEAWHARLLKRPAFVRTVCVSYAELLDRLAF
jgi:glutathione S-transferase